MHDCFEKRSDTEQDEITYIQKAKQRGINPKTKNGERILVYMTRLSDHLKENGYTFDDGINALFVGVVAMVDEQSKGDK
jgi:hypothetical protein